MLKSGTRSNGRQHLSQSLQNQRQCPSLTTESESTPEPEVEPEVVKPRTESESTSPPGSTLVADHEQPDVTFVAKPTFMF